MVIILLTYYSTHLQIWLIFVKQLQHQQDKKSIESFCFLFQASCLIVCWMLETKIHSPKYRR